MNLIYESKALTVPDWDRLRDQLVTEGWVFNSSSGGVVYLNRPHATEG